MFPRCPRRRDPSLARERARKEAAMGRRAEVGQVAERPYWRESEARVLVEAWRSSGETLARFAWRHGFEPRRLARWASRLERAADAALRFHPVRVVAHQPEGERTGSEVPIEIELASGQRVRVPRGFEAAELRRVLAVLRDAGPC
jgi:hypothetical protein